MAEWRTSYQPEEDATILAYTREAKGAGYSYSSVYPKIADQLQRPIQSVQNRHSRLMKMIEKGEYNNGLGLTDGERIALKLKSIAHEKKRSEEMSTMWQEKYEMLEEEYKSLKIEHSKLQTEHQDLLDSIKSVLGEDAFVV